MKYFSMYSGIGGFEFGIEKANNNKFNTETCRNNGEYVNGITRSDGERRGSCSDGDWECVGYSEIDKYASAIYRYHYPELTNYGDATKIRPDDLPDFDLIVGGFPCQSFSIAGKRRGFEDTRGTLFFEIARIAGAKRVKYLFLENVKGLLNHDEGKTFQTIIESLDELGYDCQWQVLNSKDHGVPQNRERVFIIGNLRGEPRPQVFPIRETNSTYPVDAVVNCIDSNYSKGWLDHGQRTMINMTPENKLSKRVYSFAGISPSIQTPCGGNHLPQIMTRTRSDQEYKDAKAVPPLRGSDKAEVRVMVNLHQKRTGEYGDGIKDESETRFTLDSGSGRDLCIVDMNGKESDIAGPVDSNYYKGLDGHYGSRTAVMQQSSIRRLTPIECERLQGFPDNWTKYGLFDGEVKEISDTQRYKCLGNAVTTNVISEIIRNWDCE